MNGSGFVESFSHTELHWILMRKACSPFTQWHCNSGTVVFIYWSIIALTDIKMIFSLAMYYIGEYYLVGLYIN